jgi:hypothetical protein
MISSVELISFLKAYKEKHGHLNIRKKENEILYMFCRNMRQSRTAIITGKGKINTKLDDDRIAALDAIGFDWNPGASSTMASKDDKFFTQVDKLRAYKEKHGHLNVHYKEDKSLYNYCCFWRSARRYINSGRGTRRKLTEEQIAALDAVGFNWNPGTSSTMATKDDKFFAQVDELKGYKEKHGHLNVGYKDDHSLYDFCNNLERITTSNNCWEGLIHYRLDDCQIAALDAIGFNWAPQALYLSSTSPSAVKSKRTQQATNPKINIGDVGDQFLKEFDSGWYNGTVVEILPHADDGWDRRCMHL